MALDPAIPLQVQVPQPTSPLQNIGSLMSLRDQASQIALRNQQTIQAQAQAKDIQAQAQQRQADLSDQQTVQQLMSDPETSKAMHTGNFSSLEGKVQPKFLDAAKQNYLQYAEGIQKKKTADVAFQAAAMADVHKSIQGLTSPTADGKPPDLGTINERYQGMLQQLTSTGRLKDAGIDITPPASIQSLDQLQNWDAQLGGGLAAYQQNLANRKAEGEIAETQAGTSQKGAQAGLETAQTDLIRYKKELYEALKANPQSLAQRVAGTIDPQKYPNEYKMALNEAMNAGDLEGINKAVETHAQSISQQERTIATEKETAPIKVANAVAIENATIPGKIRQAVETQKALAQNSPDAFASIADPKTRAAAESQYQKDSQEYAQKVSEAGKLKDYVHAAQSGNKAAPGLIPLTELRGIVNRVNQRELQAVSGGGDALDRAEGLIKNYTEGQPISTEMLKAIDKLADVTVQGARRAYEYGIQVNNKTHGGKATPIDLQPTSVDAGAPEVTSQSQYDKLPKGAKYTNNGVPHVKQ